MKKMLMIGLPMFAVALIAVGLVTGPVEGKITKGETRPLQTKTLMAHVVKPNCGAIGSGLKADEVDWDALAANAELLNECGHILMADKRCPDKTWADASKTLQECSVVVLEKIAAKDAAGAQEAFGALTKSCAACHKAHKK